MIRPTLVFVLLLSAMAAETPKHLSILGVSLHTPYRTFAQAHPDIKCRAIDRSFKSCTILGANILGVRSSRLNFNFEDGTLSNVAVFFLPAPPRAEQTALLESLSREYGKPKQESGYHGQVIYRWSDGNTALHLFMPTSESQQLSMSLFVPEE